MPHPLLLSLLTIFTLTADGAGTGMRASELSALFDLMGALLEDPSWAELHPRPCTDTPWPGVQCELIQSRTQPHRQDPFLHVTKIHIGPDLTTPPCKPTATLSSSSLLSLPFLKTLSLFSCFLLPSAVSLPPSLFTTNASSSSLEQLVLKSNPGLTGEIPSSLFSLGSLRVLSLSQNSLHGEIPEEVGGLSRLQQLDLSYNQLTGQVPEEIAGLTSLTILDLSSNKLQGEIPRSIGQLTSLQKIDLSSNLISGKITGELGKLERLVLLDLSQNSITGPVPETLSGLKDLEYFLIEDNPVETEVPLFIGALTKLSVVLLSGCGLFGPIPDCFASLHNLSALALDRNRLNGSVPSSLSSLPKLNQLNLSQNQLSGEIALGEEFVSRLGSRLDVRDNKGLCANPQLYDQQTVVSLKAPLCLDSSSSGSSSSVNKSLGEDTSRSTAGKEHDWDEGQKSSDSTSPPFERVAAALCSLGVEIFIVLSVLW